MLLLSRILGKPVHARGDIVVGRLHDITVRLDREHPLVNHLVISNRHELARLVSWDQVLEVSPKGAWLRTEPRDVATSKTTLFVDEIQLGRDLLDTQIVDVDEARMARVAEVCLNQQPNGRLELAAVDVGLGAVLRRLGVPNRLPRRAVDTRDLHLTSSRGHAIQLATSSAAVHRLDARGLAELLTRMDVERATEVIEVVGPRRAAVALEHTHPAVGTRLLLALSQQTADRVMEQLPAEKARHFRALRSSTTPLMRRRFFRHRGWRLHRPPDHPAGVRGEK